MTVWDRGVHLRRLYLGVIREAYLGGLATEA
jgi:hypothetical protein